MKPTNQPKKTTTTTSTTAGRGRGTTQTSTTKAVTGVVKKPVAAPMGRGMPKTTFASAFGVMNNLIEDYKEIAKSNKEVMQEYVKLGEVATGQ